MSNTLNIQGKELKLDKHGYLQKLSDWNQTVADALALKEGLSLTSDHWA
ncbi:TusE/DsrC/DsvC family sulfur relay protein, partial [Haliea sp. AH-315-K21]|nr:TusE/DsrC/DsvC family sulfur relay protein [Haliea sp. AH-315-K21]